MLLPRLPLTDERLLPLLLPEEDTLFLLLELLRGVLTEEPLRLSVRLLTLEEVPLPEEVDVPLPTVGRPVEELPPLTVPLLPTSPRLPLMRSA